MIEKIKNFFEPNDASWLLRHVDTLQSRVSIDQYPLNLKKVWKNTPVGEYMSLKRLRVVKENYDRFILLHYSSLNSYLPDAQIIKHVQPMKHDITLLVNLFEENNWTTYFKDIRTKETYKKELKCNEAFVYDGNGYEMWREPYEGPKKYLEFEAHYLCNCGLCLPEAYGGLALDPLNNIVYQKFKENFTVHHKNNTYEHIHYQLNMATRKHVVLDDKIKVLEEKLKKYEP
tara:strand:- start:40 stop:729 length:690 start_codon:yes stop_codon:yes gene_type:complete